jgi:hypothetical protein
VLDAFFARALAKSPEDRHLTADSFIADLESALTGAPAPQTVTPLPAASQDTLMLTATDNPPLVTPAPQKRTIPRIWGAALLLVALVASLIVLSALNLSATEPPPAADRVGVPSMTAGETFYFQSTFAADSPYNQFWPQNTGELVTSTITDGHYLFANQRTGTAVTRIFAPDYFYSEGVITLEARLDENSEPASAYGIVFRYQDEDNYNVFAVDGAGRYSIWVRQAGEWQELRAASTSWTAADAIMPRGNINTLMLSIAGDELTGYVNDTMVTRVTDSTFHDGNVGLYLATPRSGTAAMRATYYGVSALGSTAPSMTSDQVDMTPTP